MIIVWTSLVYFWKVSLKKHPTFFFKAIHILYLYTQRKMYEHIIHVDKDGGHINECRRKYNA